MFFKRISIFNTRWDRKLFSNYPVKQAYVLVPIFYGGSLTWVCLDGDQGVYKEKLPGLGVTITGGRGTPNCAPAGVRGDTGMLLLTSDDGPLTTPGVPHIYNNGQYIICTIHYKFNLSNESSISDI